MFAPALMTISRLLALGLASALPINGSAVKPVVPVTINAVQSPLATSAVRDYATQVVPTEQLSPALDGQSILTITLTSEEQALLDKTNEDREAAGLSDVQIDPLLCLIARGHSFDMAQRGYFDHIAPSPGPSSPMDRYLAALGTHPAYAFLGENIYYRSVTDTDDVSAIEANNAFMRSPGHRANILQPLFTKMGIGYYRDPNTGAFWVTEMFLRDAE